MRNRKATLILVMMLVGCSLLAATLMGTREFIVPSLLRSLTSHPEPIKSSPTGGGLVGVPSTQNDTTDIIFPDIIIDEDDDVIIDDEDEDVIIDDEDDDVVIDDEDEDVIIDDGDEDIISDDDDDEIIEDEYEDHVDEEDYVDEDENEDTEDYTDEDF